LEPFRGADPRKSIVQKEREKKLSPGGGDGRKGGAACCRESTGGEREGESGGDDKTEGSPCSFPDRGGRAVSPQTSGRNGWERKKKETPALDRGMAGKRRPNGFQYPRRKCLSLVENAKEKASSMSDESGLGLPHGDQKSMYLLTQKETEGGLASSPSHRGKNVEVAADHQKRAVVELARRNRNGEGDAVRAGHEQAKRRSAYFFNSSGEGK